MSSSTQTFTTEPIHLSTELPYSVFLAGFKKMLHEVFHTKWDINQLSLDRGLPPDLLNEIMAYNPLSICIPKKFGGRGAPAHESIAIMSEASYESLALSLMLSINYALFIQPVLKYGQEEIKESIFRRFIHHKNMGGLMITEPDFGSDALNMQTSYTENNGNFHLTGKKHWAGLTGMANFWLLTARKNTNGGLARDIDFFICDVDAKDQKIIVEESFNNLGLYIIPYGLNQIDVQIPKQQRLVPHTSGIKMMLDILHRSRVQFPGMGMGFIKRLLDEAILHSQNRMVGGRTLSSYDQVQQRLARLQANYKICSTLCVVGSEMATLENDLAPHGFEANIIKCITTDLMQESSQSLLQLVGAKGYKLNHIAGRSTVDSRPFQIFEGSNDILYIQIAEALVKKMSTEKETNLLKFFQKFHLTNRAVELTGDLINFEIKDNLLQRKLLELGQITTRIVTLQYVLGMYERKFQPALLKGATSMLLHEITNLVSVYSFEQSTQLVENYEDNSYWLNFVK